MRARLILKLVMTGFALVLIGLLVPSAAGSPAAQAATTYVVNDTVGDCGSYTATYISIQTAVDDAIDNNVKTILVCPGTTYDNFVVDGASKLTIKAALAGTYPTINPPHNATNGRIVDVTNSASVVLDGLKIDGDEFYDELNDDAYGISFRNASGTVQNSLVTRIRCMSAFTCDLGTGIMVEDYNGDGKLSTLTVKNVNITDFQVSGIAAYGPTKLTVSSSWITADYSGGLAYGFEGVTFMNSAATGSVKSTTINGEGFGSGVILNGSSKVVISGNTIFNIFSGIAIRATCNLTGTTAVSNKITGNSLSAMTNYGVVIEAIGPGCTSHADKNAISKNRISGVDGSVTGVKFFVDPGMIADKNVISGNTIAGFGSDIDKGPNATNTSVSKNIWLP